ncbi:MAG: adenylate kinase [Acidobacteria bacterium]|nr:adenylate kinase [Acidobacteriota bacterium]
MNVIMLGPPGAGKGTQAERFAQTHGVPKISTGEILREGIQQGLALALKAKEKMDRGELVDDETMIGIVRERLSRPDAALGFVLDGFPRTVSQGRALDAIMEDRASGPLIVVDITVPQEELVRRLSTRRICSTCGANADPTDSAAATCGQCGGPLVTRTDDNDRVVLERLRVYAENTKPLVDYYCSRPTFRTVNGAQPPDRVAEELEATIIDAARVGAGLPLAQR